MNEAEARDYLTSLSNHRSRPGDVSNMYGDFAIRLANTLKQANDQGMGLRLESGFRTPEQTGSNYDAVGDSSHTYGVAADIQGLGSAGSVQAQNFAKLAAANQLYNPYGINNAKEFNHWQYFQQPLEKNPQLLNQLKTAYATGNQQNVFSVLAKAGGGTQTPSASDPRQLVFNMLTSPEVGLTPQQAVGAIWSLAGESGPGLNPKSVNPNDPGGAYGLGQWIQERKANLMKFAAANNLNPADATTQVAFMKQELLGDHRNALIAIKGAATSADANHAWTTTYEIPANAEQRAAERAAAGPKSASLDANGNLVLPGVAGGAGGGTPSTGTPGTTTPTGAPAPPTPPAYPGVMTPQQQMYSGIAQSLASMGAGGGSGIRDMPDAPPIRTEAMETPTPQTSVGGTLAQLGTMGARGTLPDPNASITAGAPSMTSMLDTLGTPSTYNMFDPRATQAPSTTMRSPRIGS